MLDIRNIKNGYWWDAKGKFNSLVRKENLLKELTIQITDRCNMNCPKCNKVNYIFEDMPTKLIIDIIDQALDLGLRHIHFTGGEVTLHEGFPEIIQHCYKNRLRIDMSTNGKFAEERAKLFIEYMDSINISWDFIDKIPECFSFIFKYSPDVFINHMVMPSNYEELTDFLVYVNTHYPDVIDIQLMPPRGTADKFTKDQIKKFNDYILGKNFINYMRIYPMVYNKIQTLLTHPDSNIGIYHEPINWECHRMKSELRVGPKGYSTCTYLYRDGFVKCGFDKTVKEAWEECKEMCKCSPPIATMCQYSCSPEIANFNYFVDRELKANKNE